MKKLTKKAARKKTATKRLVAKKAVKRLAAKKAAKRWSPKSSATRAYVNRYFIALDALDAVKKDEIDAIKANTQRLLAR